MMTEQGYRTTTETAQGAVGVLSGDAAGAPAGFSMRGFDFSQVNILYNEINIGPQSFTSRVMDTFVLDRVEFLKGPSSLMSGVGAIGGAVNYVNKLPTTGPVRNEVFTFGGFAGLDPNRVRIWRQHFAARSRLSLRHGAGPGQ